MVCVESKRPMEIIREGRERGKSVAAKAAATLMGAVHPSIHPSIAPRLFLSHTHTHTQALSHIHIHIGTIANFSNRSRCTDKGRGNRREGCMSVCLSDSRVVVGN